MILNFRTPWRRENAISENEEMDISQKMIKADDCWKYADIGKFIFKYVSIARYSDI